MKNIFDAVNLNGLRLKNRLIRSATWEGIAAQDGSIGDDTYEIYRELAAGSTKTKALRFANCSSTPALIQSKSAATAHPSAAGAVVKPWKNF